MSDDGSNCCKIICLALFIIWVMVVVNDSMFACNNPTFYIDDFYVPTLNKTINNDDDNNNNNVIKFDLKIRNENGFVALHYDEIRIMFSCFPSKMEDSSIPIGTYEVPRFFQGNGKTRHVRDVVEIYGYSVVSNMPMRKLEEGGNGVSSELALNRPAVAVAVFRVDLGVELRFKKVWNTGKHRLLVGANVKVNGETGKGITSKNGIKLV